jgi:adenylate cyclase
MSVVPLRLSYRLSLAVTIPALVFAVGAITSIRSYVRTKATVHALSESVFAQVASQAEAQTSSMLGSAVPALAVLTKLSAPSQRADAHDGALTRRLLVTLQANPDFTWVSYGDSDGSFSGVSRPESNTIRFNYSSRSAAGISTRDEHDLLEDGTHRLFRHQENTGYDPRTRPWYRASVAAGGPAWTAPYIFFTRQLPGISYTQPLFNPDQTLAGVYSVDFELDQLSRSIARLQPSPHAQVFVFTPSGEVIAHPTLSVVHQVPGAEARLVRLSDVSDPAMVAFREEFARRTAIGERGNSQGHFVFTVQAARYLASVATVPIEGNLHWCVAVFAPESDMLGDVDRENRTTLLIAGASVIAAVLLALLLANRVSKPIKVLSDEMSKVGDFRLETGPQVRSMFAEIDAMGRVLEAMKRSLLSFGKFVPKDVVRAVLASGRDAQLGGEVRELTIMFSDLAGFTTLSEKLEPDALVQTLGEYLNTMAGTMTAHGGTVDKFIGDGIMTFWNAPLPNAQHALDACKAALACQNALKKLGETETHGWIKDTKTRIGVATGEVVVGNVGTPERLNYTAMGDAVNLAARLESLNKQYGTVLMIAESTWKLCKEQLVARVVDIVAVQGKAQGIKVFEPLALAQDATDSDRSLAAECERAFDLYLKREFAAAAAIWDRLASERPDDRVLQVMRERAQQLTREPPAADWDGVYVSKAK